MSARQRHLNSALAWAGARWVVDQATANRAIIIYAGDLSSMEGPGLGRKANTNVANMTRSELLDAVRHLAHRAGIAAVTVPARGTSADCPRCLAKLGHCPCPDRRSETGHKWAVCPSCGLSAGRDHAAAERICSRGLAAQDRVFLNRSRGGLESRTAVDGRVHRSLRRRSCPLKRQDERHTQTTLTPGPLDEPGSHQPGILDHEAPASGGNLSNKASGIGRRDRPDSPGSQATPLPPAPQGSRTRVPSKRLRHSSRTATTAA